MATVEKILETARTIEENQKASDELAKLILEIEDSKDPDGNVEIEITRIRKILKFPAASLISELTSKKNTAEQSRDVLVAKVKIDGK